VHGVVSHDAPGWKGDYWRNPEQRFEIALYVAPLEFSPGSEIAYSGPGYTALSYVLAASLRNAPISDLRELLRTRIMQPLSVPDNHWRISYGKRFKRDGLTLYLFEGGGRYTARAVARVGQLIVERGIWEGKTLLSTQLIDSLINGEFVSKVNRIEKGPVSELGWWSNTEGTWPNLPKDTLIGAGSGHEVLVVIPSEGLVIVRQGESIGGAQWGEAYWEALDHALLRPLGEIFRLRTASR
jgi:CubicO group peptidase (beta-lactamase class C family)